MVSISSNEPFSKVLTAGGKANSLGRSGELVTIVLNDPGRLEELYQCLFSEDAWVRMRAIDALEKVCRVHPEWFDEYIDKLLSDFLSSGQPSIQWHLAEIFTEVTLSPHQYQQVEQWLVDRLVDENVDWIVAANSMKALVHFVESGHFSIEKMLPLLRKQLNHRSASVVKKAARYLERYAY